MISVMKVCGSIDRWGAVRFSVERKDNDQGGGYESSTPITRRGG